MTIRIHRGTHQIGCVATEIRTATTRIIIDMGEELGLDADFVPHPLNISGVTDNNGKCDAIFITHIHGDHTGQIVNAKDSIPIYMGAFAKELLLATLRDDQAEVQTRIKTAETFIAGKAVVVGDISVTPYSIDHSSCDSYMFLIQSDGKKILYTGDFRLHGFRGKAIPKIVDMIGNVDGLIIEGTTLSRNAVEPLTERELQGKIGEYLDKYKYVFVLCASTNLERICAMSKAVPRGKYFVCDAYQAKLLDLLQEHWGHYSPLYQNIKKVTYGENLIPKLLDKGCLMMVRDNRRFRKVISKFPRSESIILYSMWDGYRTKENSSIPSFLELTNVWEPLHTSGHASMNDIKAVIDRMNAPVVIPIHTEKPEMFQAICPEDKVVCVEDGKEILI